MTAEVIERPARQRKTPKVIGRRTLEQDIFMEALEAFLQRPDLQTLVYNLWSDAKMVQHTGLVLAVVRTLQLANQGDTSRNWESFDDELREIIVDALSRPDGPVEKGHPYWRTRSKRYVNAMKRFADWQRRKGELD
jgi:hypothetical protein